MLLVAHGRLGRNEGKQAVRPSKPVPQCLLPAFRHAHLSRVEGVSPHVMGRRGREGGGAAHGPTCMVLWVFAPGVRPHVVWGWWAVCQVAGGHPSGTLTAGARRSPCLPLPTTWDSPSSAPGHVGQPATWDSLPSAPCHVGQPATWDSLSSAPCHVGQPATWDSPSSAPRHVGQPAVRSPPRGTAPAVRSPPRGTARPRGLWWLHVPGTLLRAGVWTITPPPLVCPSTHGACFPAVCRAQCLG